MATSASDGTASDAGSWHGDFAGERGCARPVRLRHLGSLHLTYACSAAGNATEPLLALCALLLCACILTGNWWILAYALFVLALLGLAILYSVYLDYNTQRVLEEQRAEQAKRR